MPRIMNLNVQLIRWGKTQKPRLESGRSCLNSVSGHQPTSPARENSAAPPPVAGRSYPAIFATNSCAVRSRMRNIPANTGVCRPCHSTP